MKKVSSKKIQYVAGMHGNEYMPILALASVKMPHVVANPKALSLGKRWVDVDLNKSFGIENKTYESKRAAEILKEIPEDAQVFDFHTSNSTDVPFAIIVDLAMVPLAQKTGLEHVVYMKYNIKDGHALINYRDGVSMELGRHNGSESFDNTLKVLTNLKHGKKNKIKVYEVYGKITDPGNYKNFKLYKDKEEEFYPIFVGETSYDFIGLKTKKITLPTSQ